MPTHRLSTQEMVDPGVADPAAADTEEADGENELAEDEPHGAQDYRTRVEEGQPPDDVPEAALWELGKLERTGDTPYLNTIPPDAQPQYAPPGAAGAWISAGLESREEKAISGLWR